MNRYAVSLGVVTLPFIAFYVGLYWIADLLIFER